MTYHGVAAAEGEQTDFEKGEKQRLEAFDLLRRSVMFHGRSLLTDIIKKLAAGEPLPEKNRDHQLSVSYTHLDVYKRQVLCAERAGAYVPAQPEMLEGAEIFSHPADLE